MFRPSLLAPGVWIVDPPPFPLDGWCARATRDIQEEEDARFIHAMNAVIASLDKS